MYLRVPHLGHLLHLALALEVQDPVLILQRDDERILTERELTASGGTG